MKIASYAFVIIGMIIALVSGITGTIVIFDCSNPLYIFLCLLSIIYSICSIVIGFITLWSLYNEEKKKIIGFLCIFICSLLGGIFYFCWEPISYAALARRASSKKLRNINNINSAERNLSDSEIAQKLAELKKLRDDNLISQEEYIRKRRDFLSRL
ncbi:MAG TPA: hypothetical protein DDW20_00280 [Firmicutes bacterium]|nr:hypothetical protein [Bacillota bacterium]